MGYSGPTVQWHLAVRLEALLREHPNAAAAMKYAEDRFYEAGLLPALGYLDPDSAVAFSRNLIEDNPLMADWLRLNPPRDPNHLESVEELVEELTARCRLG